MTETVPLVQHARLRLDLSCDLGESRRAGADLRRFLAKEGCHENDMLDCELALVEACNNAIKYASGESRNKPIVVEVECRPEEIGITVLDHTPGFAMPAQIELPDPESECGRGLFIMKAVTSDLRYAVGPQGNLLTLVRKRTL